MRAAIRLVAAVALVMVMVMVMVAGVAQASVTAGDAATWSDVLIVNVTGIPVRITVDNTTTSTIASGASAPPMRLPVGEHRVVRAGEPGVDMRLAGGCSAVWLLTPAGSPSPVMPLTECPSPGTVHPGDASIRVINAAVIPFNLRLSVEGQFTATAGQWSASPRIVVPAGTVTVLASRTDLPGPVAQATATLLAGHGYAAVLAGGGETPVSFSVVEDAGAQPPNPPNPSVPINTGLGLTDGSASAAAVAPAASAACRERGVSTSVVSLLRTVRDIRCGSAPLPGLTPAAAGAFTHSVGHHRDLDASPGEAEPRWVRVDRINAPVVSVPSSSMADLPEILPGDEAGWVAGTNLPGQGGVAMIVGHVDFSNQPAVFNTLDSVAPGDRVTVSLIDGTSVVYTVEQSLAVPKGQLPAWLYAPSTVSLLLLVSCTGVVSPITGLHMLNRVIVAAEG